MSDELFALAQRHGYAPNASEAPDAYLERVIAARAPEPWAMLSKCAKQNKLFADRHEQLCAILGEHPDTEFNFLLARVEAIRAEARRSAEEYERGQRDGYLRGLKEAREIVAGAAQ